jgi:coenzyme F420 hydrogenase subunit delta
VGELFTKAVLVFGCGNILWGDDGFGPAVANYLEEHYTLPPDVVVRDVGTSIRDILFDLVLSEQKPKKIIIVDAVDYPDRKPGELFQIPVGGIPEKKAGDFSLHQFPAVNMLQELKDHSQMEVKILVAQIQEIPQEVRPGLPPALEKAAVAASERIMAEIGGPAAPEAAGGLIQSGDQEQREKLLKI